MLVVNVRALGTPVHSQSPGRERARVLWPPTAVWTEDALVGSGHDLNFTSRFIVHFNHDTLGGGTPKLRIT